jgi:hypothetical protein
MLTLSRQPVEPCLCYFKSHLDLAFAVTYYKVQGQTLPRIILDLNSHGHASVDIAEVYVGLSRVKQFDHIRVFNISPKSALRLNGLMYSQTIVDWFRKSKSTKAPTRAFSPA